MVTATPKGEGIRDSLAAVCRPPVPFLKFFVPAMKLESKGKASSKETKKYGALRSPCRRLMESEAPPSEIKTELTRLCGLYNPVQLQRNVNKAILALREAIAAQYHPSGREPAD